MTSSASPRYPAVSPLMPRSPSNLNAGHTYERAKSLAMRKSVARTHDVAHSPKPHSLADTDMAEQLNEEIGNKYVKGKKLGEGTYANVYQGHLRSDPTQFVAIKKFKVQPEQQKEGLQPDVIREIKYLQEISHPSIVRLLDIYSSKDQNVNMVVEFFPNGDLGQLIQDKNVDYGPADVKAWMGMLCRAVYYCHSNFILHRDLKPNNLLIAADGNVKLADFGLARSFADPKEEMTPGVVTSWYKPPELCYGARHYSGAIDMWSVGMIFAEVLGRRPYAPSEQEDVTELRDSDLRQITLICEAVGSPTEENWPGVTKLPYYVAHDKVVPVRDRNHYANLFPTAGSDGVNLLMNMLALDPRKRTTARQALEHVYWQADPRPTDAGNLPKRGGGVKALGRSEAMPPGQLDDEQKAKGFARKLDFGGR